MKLTKQRKVYAAFLGLAAVAFVADRLLFLPAGAGAAMLPADGAAAPAETAAQTVATGTVADGAHAVSAKADEGPSLAVKLKEAAPLWPEDRDPFRRPWQGVMVSTAKTGAATASAAEPVTAAEFAAKHELKAVSTMNEQSIAVIGKLSRRVGETVDGWTVVGIDDRCATLERGNARVTLNLRVTTKNDNYVKTAVRSGNTGPSGEH